MRKIYLALIIISLLAIGVLGVTITGYFVMGPEVETESQCKINEMTYYYAEWCGWCQKVKNDRTISKLEELGVDVTEINVDIGPIQHEVRGVPTFVIADKLYSGYRTFEQLKELLGCVDE